MKNYIKILFVLLMLPVISIAQEDSNEDTTVVVVKEQLERPAFESATLIDNPTNVLFDKNTLEVQMQHRFGLINETNTLAGIYGDGANIRIALSYAIHERLTIGYGTTKNNRLQDFNWKVALLRQTRSNSMPVSVSYYGNFTIDARPESTFNLEQDRYSFFNQVIIAKRFTPNLSLQVAPSIAHYNAVVSSMENDMFAISFGGRYKISPQTAIIADYTQPLTQFELNNPHPGISIGAEFSTSAHAFQIFLTNYSGIVSQKNHMFNQNDFFNGDFLIGFNITRNYNF
ncbi:MAG: DUF5777 family beta-barrel protein [Lutibacter sp.]|nr:DUF5777 family beta-barrel protein [Lutibacter sp.]MDT8416392.1 DUF5777 family beta-barrel protein [Lutibacter sp.]